MAVGKKASQLGFGKGLGRVGKGLGRLFGWLEDPSSRKPILSVDIANILSVFLLLAGRVKGGGVRQEGCGGRGVCEERRGRRGHRDWDGVCGEGGVPGSYIFAFGAKFVPSSLLLRTQV